MRNRPPRGFVNHLNPRTASRGLLTLAGLGACMAFALLWTMVRPAFEWADRRPIGALFLASHSHVSVSNPRGWFNNTAFDVRGVEGAAKFRLALLGYADRSVAILKRTRSQGMIVWDLEGQQFPHKTTYIGDPRLVAQLAPEASGAVDEFFRRFRSAGFAVGVTVRPQQLSFSPDGGVSQTRVWNYEQLLLEKIDYARKRWGATLFYIDSNGGPWSPAEVFHLRRLARARPDVLLIPEHTYPLYYGFSAPYGSVQRGASLTGGLVRMLYPRAFQVLNIADYGTRESEVEAAYRNEDVLLFPAWFQTSAAELVERLVKQ